MVGVVERPGHASWAVTTCGSPPCRASEALALRALHSIAGTFYRISFLSRCEWSWSFHPTTCGRLVGIFP